MRILVSGASGMVGRALLADSRAARHDLCAPARTDVDFADPAACRPLMASFRPQAVIHLAAVVGGIQANLDEPFRFLAENLKIALAVLPAARDAGAKVALNVGSSCMYPRGFDRPLRPDDLLTGPFEPTNEGYAVAKVAAWKLGQALARETPSFACKTLIPCNLYGPLDDFDPRRAHLVAAAVGKIVEAQALGRDTVEIWGDGEARREFMYAADLADFLWTFVERPGDLPDTLNVGPGRDHTVREYYDMAAAAAGWRGRFVFDRARPAGMERKLLDVSALAPLGWRPRTPLAEGLSATVAAARARLAAA